MHDDSQTCINDDIHNDIDIYMNINIDEDIVMGSPIGPSSPSSSLGPPMQ